MARNHKGTSPPASVGVKQVTLPLVLSADERLDVSTLETWLWDAACAIRGATGRKKKCNRSENLLEQLGQGYNERPIILRLKVR